MLVLERKSGQEIEIDGPARIRVERRAGLNPDVVLEVPTACSYAARQAGVDVNGKPN